MDMLQAFAEWAWARHHNPLSWYIRPLLLVPFCWFAWRRSVTGMVCAVIALLTSMFWFPAPERPDPRAVAFLEAERHYLTAPWGLVKIFFAATVPLFFILVGQAFWRRSLVAGLMAIAAGCLIKIAWSFAYGGSSGWSVVAPALGGLAVVAVALLATLKQPG